jgi:hypothetical protein
MTPSGRLPSPRRRRPFPAMWVAAALSAVLLLASPMAPAPAAGGLAANALGAAGLGGSHALLAQAADFPLELREGAAFHRTVRVSSTHAGERSEGSSHMVAELEIRVTELREDGSGMLEARLTSMEVTSEGSDNPLQTWDSRTSPTPEDPVLGVYAEMMERTFELPFLPGGQVDSAPFTEAPEDDRATVVLWTLVLLVGPQDRADALPVGFPETLEPGSPQVVPPPAGVAQPGVTYVLEEVSEEAGRRVARVRFEGSYGTAGYREDQAEGVAEGGYARIDLDANRILEVVRESRRTMQFSGGEMSWRLESRTVPVG